MSYIRRKVFPIYVERNRLTFQWCRIRRAAQSLSKYCTAIDTQIQWYSYQTYWIGLGSFAIVLVYFLATI